MIEASLLLALDKGARIRNMFLTVQGSHDFNVAHRTDHGHLVGGAYITRDP